MEVKKTNCQEKGLSHKEAVLFHVQKEPGSVKRPANAVECSCETNTETAKRLYRNGEWISTGNATELRGEHTRG